MINQAWRSIPKRGVGTEEWEGKRMEGNMGVGGSRTWGKQQKMKPGVGQDDGGGAVIPPAVPMV